MFFSLPICTSTIRFMPARPGQGVSILPTTLQFNAQPSLAQQPHTPGTGLDSGHFCKRFSAAEEFVLLQRPKLGSSRQPVSSAFLEISEWLRTTYNSVPLSPPHCSSDFVGGCFPNRCRPVRPSGETGCPAPLRSINSAPGRKHICDAVPSPRLVHRAAELATRSAV